MYNRTYFEPMGIGEILDVSLDIFKEHFRKLYMIAFLGYVPMIVAVIVFIILSIGMENDSVLLPIILFPVLAVAAIMSLIGMLTMKGGLTKASSDILFNREFNVKACLRFGLGKWFPYGIAGLLAALAIGFGYLFLIIPGVLFTTWFFLIGPVTFLEDSGYVAALSRSRELVKGYFWRTFGFAVAMSLLGFALIGAVSQVLSIIPLIGQVLSLFVQITILPLQTIATTLYYYNQKSIMEGYDLGLRAEHLYSGSGVNRQSAGPLENGSNGPAGGVVMEPEGDVPVG